MQSAGNDIIALGMINVSRSNDSRFYTKILTDSEQVLYHATELANIPFAHFLWMAWSVKESVYKYLKRGIPDLSFSPTNIILKQVNLPKKDNQPILENGQWQGLVNDGYGYTGYGTYGFIDFYFRTKMNEEIVATVVSDNKTFTDTWWGIRKIEETDPYHQSKKVRQFLLESLQTVLSNSDLRLEETTFGYPAVFMGTEELNLPVSLSHHGKFIAYSFMFQSPELTSPLFIRKSKHNQVKCINS